MILAGIATYFNSRASVARQSPEAAANPQTAMMNKLALYVFPLGVVVGGPFLPLAIILYWFANNIWTFGQQHYVFGMIEKEEEAKKLEAQERRAANAPAPGAKPKSQPKRRQPSSEAARSRRRRRGDQRRRDGQRIVDVADGKSPGKPRREREPDTAARSARRDPVRDPRNETLTRSKYGG